MAPGSPGSGAFMEPRRPEDGLTSFFIRNLSDDYFLEDTK